MISFSKYFEEIASKLEEIYTTVDVKPEYRKYFSEFFNLLESSEISDVLQLIEFDPELTQSIFDDIEEVVGVII